MTNTTQPPLGIKPRRINDEARYIELLAAITRRVEHYGLDGMDATFREWNEEAIEIAERYETAADRVNNGNVPMDKLHPLRSNVASSFDEAESLQLALLAANHVVYKSEGVGLLHYAELYGDAEERGMIEHHIHGRKGAYKPTASDAPAE